MHIGNALMGRLLANPYGHLPAVYFADPGVGQQVAADYERVYPSTPTDNIFNSNAMFKALGEMGFKVNATGGRLFEAPLEFAVNTTMQMVGPDQELQVTRIPVFDAARYDQKVAAGTISYNHLNMAQNRGTEAKFALIEGLIENGRKSHISLINQQMWNTSTPSSTEITAIPFIISTSPTASVSVGGINGGTFTWWRNRANSGAKAAVIFDNLQYAFRNTWEQCSLGGTQMTPTAIVSDQTTFSGFEGTMVTNLRYFTDDLRKKGDPGFVTSAINFKETPYFYDEDHPAARADFLNNEVLKFEYLDGYWLKLYPEVDPANQLANVHKMATFGNLICSARRHLGVVYSTTS